MTLHSHSLLTTQVQASTRPQKKLFFITLFQPVLSFQLVNVTIAHYK